MVMSLLIKLIGVQLLLLCAGIGAEEYPSSMVLKGGFYDVEGNYVMDENRTIEVVVTLVGNEKTKVVWTFDSGNLTEPNATETRESQNGNKPYIITSTLRFVAHKKMGRMNLNIENNEYGVSLSGFRYMVQSAKAPEITLNQHNAVSPNENVTNRFTEKDEFILSCVGGGMVDFTLTWVDSKGDPFESNQATVFSRQHNIEDTEEHIHLSKRSLRVLAMREMTSFGCRMEASNYQSHVYNVTSWFNFTVGGKPDVKLIADYDVCDQVTFSCLNNEVNPDKVEWILDGEIFSLGSQNLTLNSSVEEFQAVECSMENDFGFSSDSINFNILDIANCSRLAAQLPPIEKSGLNVWFIMLGIAITTALGFSLYVVLRTTNFSIYKVSSAMYHTVRSKDTADKPLRP